MDAVWEIVLTLLASVGLAQLCRLAVRPLTGGRPWGGPVLVVVPACGDAPELEGQVRRLAGLGRGELRLSVIIADRGLNPAGRAAASAVVARNPGLVLCPADRLGQYISGL